MGIQPFSFPLCGCRALCEVTCKLIGKVAQHTSLCLTFNLNPVFQGTVSYTTHFTLTALICNGTQFRIRNSLVESDYLSQVFLRHELLLLSFCSRFLLMKQQPWTKEAGNSWVYQVQEDLRTSYRPFTWLQVWVFVSHVWINNENRHLVEKYEHAPSFHWKTLGYVKRTTKIYLSPTRGLSGAELISDSKSLMSGLALPRICQMLTTTSSIFPFWHSSILAHLYFQKLLSL